mmetsp:Transcript_21549/g.32720  ORF Transcript_21549/g.32720 Transcript_21549/m.32720 type:complete len:1288 (-) Transcript_21549:1312-5175(-)
MEFSINGGKSFDDDSSIGTADEVAGALRACQSNGTQSPSPPSKTHLSILKENRIVSYLLHFDEESSTGTAEEVDGVFRASKSNDTQSPSSPPSKTPLSILKENRIMNYLLHSLWKSDYKDEEDYNCELQCKQQCKRYLLITVLALMGLILIVFAGREAEVEIEKVISDSPDTRASIVHHDAFVVEKHSSIPEIQATMVLYRHKQTRAEILTIVPNQSNKSVKGEQQQKAQAGDSVFGVSVKTQSDSNSGAAHVLMKGLWDGSTKYPLKDPIREYSKGSLNTYLDATCLEDRTLYTAATRNRDDWRNLIQLMLDALFHPLLLEDDHSWIFRKEGWRVESEMRKGDEGYDVEELVLNGEVLDVQRSIYNDPDEMIHRYARRSLFHDTRMQYDAQGIPRDIYLLDRIGMKNFYHKHYHPTNMQIFFYGSLDDIHDGLNLFHYGFAKQHGVRKDKLEMSMAKLQKWNLQEPALEIHSFQSPNDADENEDATRIANHVMTSWLINEDIMTTKTELAWKVIEYMLVGTPVSILRRALDETQMGTEVVGDGLDTTYQQWRFSIGLKGVVEEDDVTKVDEVIEEALKQIVENGFDQESLKAAMNYVYMQNLDYNNDRALCSSSTRTSPRGVHYFHKALEKWSYGHEPSNAFEFDKEWRSLQAELFNPKYHENGDQILRNLINSCMLENTHRAHIRMTPRKDDLERQSREEQERIDWLGKNLGNEDFMNLMRETDDYETIGSTPELTEVYEMLPKLASKYIEFQEEDIHPLLMVNQSRVSTEHQVMLAETVVAASYGMLFVDFGIDLRDLLLDELVLVPVIARLMLQTASFDYSKELLNHKIHQVSTGISHELMLLDVLPKKKDKGTSVDHQSSYSVHEGDHLATKIFFRGQCMVENLNEYLSLLQELVFQGREFTKVEIETVIKELIEEAQSWVEEESHILADIRMEARYSNQGFLIEQVYGISQLQNLHSLLLKTESDFDSLKTALERAHKALVQSHRSGMVFSVTGEPELLEEARPIVDEFLTDGIPNNDEGTVFLHPSDAPHPWIKSIVKAQKVSSPIADEVLIVATPVASVGKIGVLYPAAETTINGSTAAVAHYLSAASYLYRKDRSQHISINYRPRHGTLQFLSTQDDSPESTLESLEQLRESLSNYILDKDYLPEDAQQAIIGAVAKEQQPERISQVGWHLLIDLLSSPDEEGSTRSNAKDRIQWRQEMLLTTREDFIAFVNDLLAWRDTSVAVVSSSNSKEALSFSNNDTSQNITDANATDIGQQLSLIPVCQHWSCNFTTSSTHQR